MSGHTARLTEGSIARHLAAMALPMGFGILAMMGFNLIDTWFIARIGTAELAAISFTFPVMMIVSSIAIGLGAGTSSVLARAIGRGNRERVQRLATDSLVLSLVSAVALAAIGYLTIDPLFRLLGANDSTLPLIRQFMSVWYVSAIFLIVPMVGMGAIRATGDTRLPSLLMIVGAIVNLILDPILIFGIGPIPRLELLGAAYAGLTVRVLTFAATVVLLWKLDMLTRHLRSLRDLVSSWREILHVGLPAAGTNAIIPLSTGIVTAMLASYGQSVVAGFGVASRVESVSLIMFYAMSAIIGPFVGQNLAVGNKERIFEALRLCMRFSLLVGIGLAALLAVFGHPIARLFDENQEVVRVASLYLLLVPLSYGTAGMVMIVNASFNGLGRPLPAVMISASRVIFIYLPLAWLGASLFEVPGIFAAYALANIICGVGGYYWLRRVVAGITPDAHE